MNHRIRRLTAVVSAALFLSASAVMTVFAESGDDLEGPELGAVTLYGDPTTLPGGKIEMGLNAADESGMKKIVVRFQNESGKQLSFQLRETADDSEIEERYGGRLRIPKTAQAGVYRLKSIELTDRQENVSRYYYRRQDARRSEDDVYLLDEEPVCFTILAQTATPSAAGCTISKQEIPAGATAQLTFWTEGNPASLKKATLVFRNPANGRKILCTVDQDDRQEDGSYQAILEVSAYEPAGNFALCRMSVEDLAGSKQDYSESAGDEDSLPLPISCGFSVTGGRTEADSKPRLESISIVADGTEGNNWNFRLTVQVSDNGSGMDHITVRFENPANARTVSKVLKAEDGKNGVFTGTLAVSRSEPAGTFELDNVGLTDGAKNYQAYCRPEDVKETNHKLALPQPVSFTLGGGSTGEPDETAPVLQSVQVSPESADVGSLIRVDAVVTDDLSGVDTVRLRFESYSGKAVSVDLVHRGENRFSGTIKASKTKTGGTYRLVKASLKDQAGNTRTYYDRLDGRNGELLQNQPQFTLQEDE